MALHYIMIGERIRTVRKARRLTQAALAERISKDESFISRLESGEKVMSLETMVDIANALDCSIFTLLDKDLKQRTRGEDEWIGVITDCDEYERRILMDIVLSMKESLRANRDLIIS